MAKSIGAAIRAARERLGKTQEEVASSAGMSPPAYNRLELGDTDPRWSTVLRVAAALNLGLDDMTKGLVEGVRPPRVRVAASTVRSELRAAARDLAAAAKRIADLEGRLGEQIPAPKTRSRRR